MQFQRQARPFRPSALLKAVHLNLVSVTERCGVGAPPDCVQTRVGDAAAETQAATVIGATDSVNWFLTLE